jgi:hypothetical protein
MEEEEEGLLILSLCFLSALCASAVMCLSSMINGAQSRFRLSTFGVTQARL